MSSERRSLADEPDGSGAPQIGALARRSPDRRALVPRLRVPYEKRAANDASAQPPAEELGRLHGLRLDEMIREIVRAEVRAEVARALAIAPAQPTHVSVAEYAAARSISVSTVRNAIRSGRLPALRIGTAVRVPIDAEIGRPVIANANRHDANPVTRAGQILTGGIGRSALKTSIKRVA